MMKVNIVFCTIKLEVYKFRGWHTVFFYFRISYAWLAYNILINIGVSENGNENCNRYCKNSRNLKIAMNIIKPFYLLHFFQHLVVCK